MAAAADTSAAAAAIARRLASCNGSTRERAIRHLFTFLPASAPHLSRTDLLKLWKGLFFCFWHSDKPLYQSSLASRLATAVSSAPSPAAAAYLAAYLSTLRREWPHIDAHRLDKFYLLNRRFLHHAFLLLSAHSFAPDLTSQIISILSEKAILPEADTVAVGSRGLGYHVAEAFLDELLPVLPVSLQSMDLLLAPFFTVLEKSSDRVMVNKVKSSVFERFLESGKQLLEMVKKGEEVEKGSVEEKLGKVGLLFGFSTRFFDIGAKVETVQANRKVVFGLRDAFVKVEKGLELVGAEIHVPEFEGTEVPMVTGVENGTNLDEVKVEKMKKKAKKAALAAGEKVGAKALKHEKEKKDKTEKEEKKEKKKKAKKAALAAGEKEVTKALKHEKKEKKDKKEKGKKEKKKKRVQAGDGGDVAERSTDATAEEDQQMGDGTDAITFDEALMSNLQKQFEKVAAEAGMANGGSSSSASPVTPASGKIVKKRKRAKSADRLLEVSDGDDGSEGNVLAQDGEKSGKKVRFSMKNNLVWKPHNPLPPQCLRLPLSATPRGSALKKGVQPGPIKETSTLVKKTKPEAKSAKKILKKKPSSAVKRLRKLQSFSA